MASKSPARSSNLATRVVTSLIGAPVAIGLLWIGGWPFALFVLAIALLAQYELFLMLQAKGIVPLRLVGFGLGIVVGLHALWPRWWTAALGGVILLLVVELFRRKPTPLENVSGTLFSLAYPVLLFTHILDLRRIRTPEIGSEEAFWLTFTVVFLVWTTDTFAYFAGRAFGRTPLMPSVSPKKTWEGAVGGLAGALLIALLLKTWVLDFLSTLDVLAIALICGALSQVGDLAESWFKRASGVKDSSHFLPGHGGLLDRIDSLLFAVPLVYLYLVLFVL